MPLAFSAFRLAAASFVCLVVTASCSSRNTIGAVATMDGGPDLGPAAGIGGMSIMGSGGTGAGGGLAGSGGALGGGGTQPSPSSGGSQGTAGTPAAASGGSGDTGGQGQAGNTPPAGGAGVAGVAGMGVAGSIGSMGGVGGQSIVKPPAKAEATFALVAGNASGSQVQDLNGDGRLDLIGLKGTGLGIAFGNGDGTFMAPVIYDAQASGFAIGDLNGDGAPDIATSGGTAVTVGRARVFMNRGNGALAAPVDYAASFQGQQIQLADFNGDGQVDMAMACTESDLEVFLNLGKGVFAASNKFHTNNNSRTNPNPSLPFDFAGYAYNPWRMVTGDVNGDGAVDLGIVFTESVRAASVLLNDGTGAFVPSTIVRTDFGGDLGAIIIGDLDRDGKAEVVWGGVDRGLKIFSSVSTFVEISTRDPSTTTGAPLAVIDMNGDGYPDVVTDMIVGYGAPDGVLVAGTPDPRGKPDSAGRRIQAVGDVNGDGKPDLVTNGGVLLNTTP